MWRLLALLLLVSCCQANDKVQENFRKFREFRAKLNLTNDNFAYRGFGSDSSLFSSWARYVGGSDVAGTSVPWIVSVFEQPEGSATFTSLGPGAIINKYWAIINSNGANSINNQNDVFIVSKSDVIGDHSSAGLTVRRVKYVDFDVHDATSGNIGILRFCPAISDPSYHAPMPTSSFSYILGDTITFYTYVPHFHRFTKTISAMSGCSTFNALFDRSKCFCSNTDPANKLDNTDLRGAMAVVNGVFAGFTIDRGTGAELFLDISQYITWLNANTPTDF